MENPPDRLHLLESEIERRLAERFAALRDEFERLRLESDRRWAGFLSRFEQRLTGVVPPELLAAAAQVPAPGNGLAGAAAAARTLDTAASQAEILDRYLELSSSFASRAILLVLRGEALGVWKAVGMSSRGVDSQILRRVSFPTSDPSGLSRLMAGEPLRFAGDNPISSRLMCRDVAEAVLVPFVIREKVSGALYADTAAGERKRFDPDALALLTYLAGLAIERLATRKGASPSLKTPTPTPTSRAATAPESFAPREDTTPTPPPVPAAPRPVSYETQIAGLWRDQEDRTPPMAPPAGSTGFAAAGTGQLGGPLAPSEPDQRCEDARRFAKLLVSEIKLYNGQGVAEGRARGNLYQMLKEDIDRSRQMYDERIPPDVRASRDFLYEELVNVLAEGRPELLGI